MSLIKAQGAGEVSTGFYDHLLDQSLKFNDADNPYLRWAPASQGSLTTFTFSFWYKRCVFGTYQEVFHEYPGSGERSQILFMNDDTFKVELEAANTNHFRTNRVFRDPSAWYNIVVAFDSTNGTEASRVKIYVNGVDESDTANGGSGFSTANYPNQHATSGFNRTNDHEISTYDGSDYHLDGYLAEVNFIDGTALTAASFGETKNGIWIPKDTSGLTFGTNGFHLTFKDDVVSEGFNTAIYEGNSTTQSISGLGFSPGLVWVKDRDNGNSNAWSDVVRGRGRNLISNATNAEVSAAAATDKDLISFDADGFSVGQFEDGTYNNNGSSMVAWCWEAGGAPTADNSAGTSAVPTSNSAKVDGSNHGSALSGSIAFTRASANTTKGFSVITYTGNGSAGATVDHLLGDTPDWYIVKRRDSSASWQVFHTSLGATKFLDLQGSGAAETNTNRWNDTAPTSSVVSLGTNSNVNSNGGTYVMYCWAGKSGYSAFGSYTGNGGSQAIDVGFNPAWVMLRRTNGSTWGIFDNTRQTSGADRNLQMLGANSSAVETTNSQMTFSGNTFNDNGYLSDSGTTVLYMAFADTREAAFFKDVSGNGQHWSPVNLDYRDSVPDVPTNNFNILNALHKRLDGTVTISEGNLQISAGASYGGDNRFAGTTGVSSGKWYFEMLRTDATGLGNQTATGVFDADTDLSSGQYSGNPTSSGAATNEWALTDRGVAVNGSTYTNLSGTIGTVTQNKVVQVAVDMDNKKIWFGIDNTFSGDPAAGSGEAFSNLPTTILPMLYTAQSTQVFNFGQDSSFAGNKSTANSNADGNGHGSFAYAPPSGFLALCSQNLPDPAITDGTEHFNTVLYTAASSNGTYNITGNGFQPDFSWVKNRDDVERHFLFDSVRGNTSMTDKFLVSDQTSAEGANGVVGTTVTVNADGMQIVESSIDNGELYFNSRTYVMWNWLAGGSASTNTDGSVNAEVSVNTTAGFSIATFTGVATGGDRSFGHGLGKAPTMVWVKKRSGSDFWFVWHKDLSTATDNYLRLNENSSEYTVSTDNGIWGGGITSSVVGMRGTSFSTGTSDTFVGYSFTDIEGYSKAGSYVGNANADGPFVYTGGRVQWLLLKNISASENWYIWDNAREPINIMNERQHPNLAIADQTSSGRGLDFLSNGFKIRGSDSSVNGSGNTIIYLAIMEQPFKFSNAR